jgi:thiamine transport system substrate-binding protein
MKENQNIIIIVVVVLAAILVLLTPQNQEVKAQDDITLTLVTHSSFAMSESVQQKFEEETGITLEVLRLDDAGAMINQSILTKNNPFGDVLFGIDNTFLSRGLEYDLFVAYESPLLENVPAEFQLDAGEFRVTPVSYGDVCLNYDVSYFEENALPLPRNLSDLADPMYKGLLVVENPASSSPGLAFLLATVAQFGDDGDYTYLDYWEELVENDVLVVDSWETAYYGQFSVSSEDGQYPLVVSYASSPPAEVIFAEEELDAAPTGAIVEDGTCFRQIEFVGILNGTDNEEAAQKLIDFMLSTDFQEDVPMQMFVFPVNTDAQLPEAFVEYAAIPDNPGTLSYDEIEQKREQWIQDWTEAVLR